MSWRPVTVQVVYKTSNIGRKALKMVGKGINYFYTHKDLSIDESLYPQVIRSKTYRGYGKPRIIPNAIYIYI
jgi:hypothetical protein